MSGATELWQLLASLVEQIPEERKCAISVDEELITVGGHQESDTKEPTGMSENSAFDPENYKPVQLIMMMRLYDLGLALLSVFDEKKAEELVELHEKGFSYTPAPAFIEYEDPDETKI